MFAMAFEDNEGNRLSIPGEITITIPQQILGDTNDTSNIRVWTLNPSTGLWEFTSDLEEISDDESNSRRKRQIQQGESSQRSYKATLRGIPINAQWFNFDAISTQTCVVKVRLFKTERYLESNQLSSGRVSVVLQDSNGYNSLSSNRVSTDTSVNGHCMVLPCQSSRSRSSDNFRGFIFADDGTDELIPARDLSNNGLQNSQFNLNAELGYVVSDNKIQVDFNQRLVNTEGLGPFYDWERKWRYSSSCSGANFETSHFRFSKIASCLIETDAYNVIPGKSTAALPLHLLLWYDVSSYFPYIPGVSADTRRRWAFRTCYIKVIAPHNSRLEAVSYIADERHPFYDTANNVYGIREDCALDGAVCLQVRPPTRPSMAAHGYSRFALDDESKTLIRIRVVDERYFVVNVSSRLIENNALFENILTNVSAYEDTFEVSIAIF